MHPLPNASDQYTSARPYQLSHDGFSRVASVAALTGVSVATIWRWAREGRMPAAVRIGPNCTGWKNAALLDWIADPAGWSQRNQGQAA